VITFGSFGIIGKFIMIYFGKKYLEEDLQSGLLVSGGGGGADGEYHEPTLHAPGDSAPQNSASEQQQQQQHQYQQTVSKGVVVGGYQSAL